MTQSNTTKGNQGLGSKNMDEKTAREIHSAGGKASARSSKGVVGSTEAARHGGEKSHDK